MPENGESRQPQTDGTEDEQEADGKGYHSLESCDEGETPQMAGGDEISLVVSCKDGTFLGPLTKVNSVLKMGSLTTPIRTGNRRQDRGARGC